MKLEDDRNRKMTGDCETRISKLEARIEKTRARLTKERGILTKHEIALGRKAGRGSDTETLQGWVDKKRELVTALEEKLEEMEVLAQLTRQQLTRLTAFNPVQDSLNSLPFRFRRAEKGEWHMVNSRFKTFQDIFTPSEARIVPNTKNKLTRKRYDRLPLDACPVDPGRIPDWFLEEFDLGNQEGLSDFEVMEQKVEITPHVREIFSHLQPLEVYGRQTHRVMVLQEYDPAHDGKLLRASYRGCEEKEKDRKTMQVFGSVYEADKSMFHAEEGYEREQEKVDGIEARLRGILDEVRGMRSDDPKREKMTKRIEAELEVLGHVLNLHKVEAADILAEVKDIRDKSGRHNPGATCARMVASVNALGRRLPQIFEKSRWVSDDKKILSKTIHRGRGELDRARIASLDLCEALENGSDDSEIAGRLKMLPCLEGLTVRPFNLYAGKFREKKRQLIAALRSGDRDTFRDAAINAYVACKTFEVQHERERILRDIAASPMETSIESLLVRARRLGDMVTSKETFGDVRTGRNEPYREMASKVINIVRGLEAYKKRKLSESERLAMYERLKAYIEEIDFTEILEKL